ncbi:MAG TPA: hypothetical protein VFH78_12115 [Candidatus Thermoplasmatota archaeon]|nr:hypothetical protein [Candidatus Thermoplasmatota archaeon]
MVSPLARLLRAFRAAPAPRAPAPRRPVVREERPGGGMQTRTWHPTSSVIGGQRMFVRSAAHARVADRLAARGVRHRYEPFVGLLRPTFLLPHHRIAIEFRLSAADAEGEERRRAYVREGLRLVLLDAADDEELAARLEPLLATRASA